MLGNVFGEKYKKYALEKYKVTWCIMLYIAFHKKRYITCIKVLVLYDTILKQYYFIIISYLYCRFALQIVYLLIA
jgi:hypothetical protein